MWCLIDRTGARTAKEGVYDMRCSAYLVLFAVDDGSSLHAAIETIRALKSNPVRACACTRVCGALTVDFCERILTAMHTTYLTLIVYTSPVHTHTHLHHTPMTYAQEIQDKPVLLVATKVDLHDQTRSARSQSLVSFREVCWMSFNSCVFVLVSIHVCVCDTTIACI